MSYTKPIGRLGNQIIRNLAIHFIAKKHNLETYYSSEEIINDIGIYFYKGENNYSDTISINDGNYFEILNAEHFNHNLDIHYVFFQTYEISRIIHDYLNSE
jgi:hypothetical protein